MKTIAITTEMRNNCEFNNLINVCIMVLPDEINLLVKTY